MAGPRPMALTVQLVVRGERLGQEVINTFYYKYPPGADVGVPQMQALSAWWIANVSNELCACLHQDYQMTELRLVNLGVTPQIGYNRLLSPPLQGQRGDTSAPGNVSVGLRRVSAPRGKSYRGRIELGPISNTNVLRDAILPTLQTFLANLAIKLLLPAAPVGGPAMVPAVGSFKLVASEAITAWVFDLVTDSMKTRLLGHGE